MGNQGERRKTPLKEYEQSGKSSVFLGKHIGEQNDSVGGFHKAIVRSQRERELKLNKKRKYVSERDDLEDEVPFDDDDAAEATATKSDETGKLMEEDWISQMPDEILVNILSLLTMKEAGSTSVLSRRWKNLWTFTTGSMEFDCSVIMWTLTIQRPELFYVARKSFVRWVNRILASHQGPTISDFRVVFDLDGVEAFGDISLP
ncbi:hypothetical protein F0562_033013 [Nyssa sinensis]|uniref:F-box domain-containing protein n=1 Tax=Nyssa sinensis TaxID=561372 RepID=A0A5J5AQK0_9ASTE|nr:hypothetical protein F0562_033013 [Nyssa sinensis]